MSTTVPTIFSRMVHCCRTMQPCIRLSIARRFGRVTGLPVVVVPAIALRTQCCPTTRLRRFYRLVSNVMIPFRRTRDLVELAKKPKSKPQNSIGATHRMFEADQHSLCRCFSVDESTRWPLALASSDRKATQR
ncbi:hypothetical protein FRC18_003639 [Serendipita sp. 400]|nr:hypothetical protein FRC18_003639 [Serendipita sp. 400]